MKFFNPGENPKGNFQAQSLQSQVVMWLLVEPDVDLIHEDFYFEKVKKCVINSCYTLYIYYN